MARASKRIYEALRHLCDGRVFVARAANLTTRRCRTSPTR